MESLSSEPITSSPEKQRFDEKMYIVRTWVKLDTGAFKILHSF
jgi:hypothetical protein